MAGKFNAKFFNGEVFQKYIDRIPNPRKTELLKSRAIRSRPELASSMRDEVGGNYISTPLKGLISGSVPMNYDGNTDITPSSTETFMQSRVVVGRANAWAELDFSYDITGGEDFMENVAEQINDYWNEIDQDTLVAILKGVFSMTDTQGSTYTRFLWAAIGIGLPMLALLTLRLTDRWFPIPEVVPEAWIPVLGLLATVGLAVLLLFQVGLLRITGYVTLSRPITDQLVALKFNYLALSVVFLCPLILLFLLASPDTGHILSFGILILGGALLLLYLKESLMLFLSKKISILHWFLYLCAVEIFPVSFVWLSLTRI